jgi:dsDNA-specific endonuclease/ATPase MutS2
VKLTLDLHEIYNSGPEIEKALKQKFDEAVAKKAPVLEIIPGKGSGQLKKHVLRFLDNKRSSVKNMRIEKPSKNFGTIKVHFNWNEPGRR